MKKLSGGVHASVAELTFITILPTQADRLITFVKTYYLHKLYFKLIWHLTPISVTYLKNR